MEMFTKGFRERHGGPPAANTGEEQVPRTVYEHIALSLFAVSVPFFVIWMFYITAERGITFYDRFKNWEWEEPALIDKAATNASEAYQNVILMEEMLIQLEMAGKELWGPRHSWQVPGYDPSWKPGDFEEKISHPNFSLAWAEKADEFNSVQSETVLSRYAYIREYYSLTKFLIDDLHAKSRNAARGLPDDATILKSLDNLKVYANTAQGVRKIEYLKQIFVADIAPFFVERPPVDPVKRNLVAGTTLSLWLGGAFLLFTGRKKRQTDKTLQPEFQL